MYDIIFFTDVTNNIASIPPIGAYKCAHVLRSNGFKCLVVNHFSTFTEEELVKLIDLTVDGNTKLIGFSTTFLKNTNVAKIAGERTPLFQDILHDCVFPQGKDIENRIIKKCREKNNNIKTVAGGSKAHPNFNNKNIDYVCIGYSEISIINLVTHLVNKTDILSATKNIWGCTVLDDRFARSYDFANSDFKWLPEDVVNHKTLPIEISRGCIFKCKFCSFPMNGKQNLDFVKSEDNLLYEMQRNYEEFGVEQYVIIDDTFNDHEAKLETLRRVVNKLKFQPKFWGYHRLDLIATRPNTIPILHDIGVRAMFFGIETLNPKSAKIIGKGYNGDKQVAALELLRSKFDDISLHGSFIIGLPEDTEEYAHNTYQRILNQEIPLHTWEFGPLIIFKKTLQSYSSDIDKNYELYGYSEDDDSEAVPIMIASFSDNRIINWKNKHTTFNRVSALSNQIMSESYGGDKLYLQGQTALSIASMNHPDYKFDKIKNIKFNNFNFHDIEENVRPNFIKEYKEKLFALIAQR
jgi:radical SAM superfamily enzyme YgiQ (UPF0313 family)